MGRFQDISGNKYGRLTVVEYVGSKNGGNSHYWKCVCDCGNTHTCLGSSLKSGNTKSCGCLKREIHTTTKRTDFRENYSHLPEYSVWSGMKQRCYNENDLAYNSYGGRGILMAEQWKESFEVFLSDMGKRPSKEHTIERIDNNKGYSKENCVWLHKTKQSRNKRNTVRLFFNGKKTTLPDVIEKHGLNSKSVWSKICQGYSPEEAINHFIER